VRFLLSVRFPLAAQSYRVPVSAATAAHPRPRCMHLSGGDGFVTMADSARATFPPTSSGSAAFAAKRMAARAPAGYEPAGNRVSGNCYFSHGGGANADRLLADPTTILTQGTLAANESARPLRWMKTTTST